MKNILLGFLVVSMIFGCTKKETVKQQFTVATYFGTKSVQREGISGADIDTIYLLFDSSAYSYTSTHRLDNGTGTYTVKDDVIEFTDTVGRIDLYTWDWILSGKFKFTQNGSSLELSNGNKNLLINCNLKMALNDK
jgi:hypothetical protein